VCRQQGHEHLDGVRSATREGAGDRVGAIPKPLCGGQDARPGRRSDQGAATERTGCRSKADAGSAGDVSDGRHRPGRALDGLQVFDEIALLLIGEPQLSKIVVVVDHVHQRAEAAVMVEAAGAVEQAPRQWCGAVPPIG
jgi:hypothetical protein